MASNSGPTWSKEEMIQNADTWSLAGDVALLNTMKSFSDNLLTETMNISSRIDNLINSLKDVGLRLDISRNEFQSLRNTQFIENRVYEDDETIDDNENKNEEKPLTEEEKDRILKESVKRGLEVMEKYFDKVEVSVSDSEDETGDKSLILQPKDIYADRPLPFLIGSEEWYKKWHVGLVHSSSESESEKEPEEVYSESSSEDELPKDNIKGSETSSELEYSGRQSQSNAPVANSTFNDVAAQRQHEVVHLSSDGEDKNSIQSKTPISNETFAEQLASKLGDVINQKDDLEVNKNPIKKAVTTNKYMGNLFSDEPPPLDDTILPKNAKSDLFSGGTGLFDDDNEDDLFWGQNKTITKAQKDENKNSVPSSVDNNDNNVPIQNVNILKAQVTRGLFDSDDSSEEDFLTTTKRQTTNKPFLEPFKPPTTLPLFSDEPPELEVPQKKPLSPLFDGKEEEKIEKKKPIGGVSVFGGSDLFSEDIQQKIASISSEDVDRPKSKVVQNEPEEDNLLNNNVSEERKVEKTKKISLFDDDTIFDDDDIFKNVVVQPKKVNEDEKIEEKSKANLFEDTEDIFEEKRKEKKVNLFDDNTGDDSLFKDDIFKNVAQTNKKSNLFEDFKEDKTEIKEEKDKKTEAIAKIRKNVSLFDDSSSEEEDSKRLKEESKKEEKNEQEEMKRSLFEDIPEDSEDIFTGFEEKKEKEKEEGLFDDNTIDEPDDLLKSFKEKINVENDGSGFEESKKDISEEKVIEKGKEESKKDPFVKEENESDQNKNDLVGEQSDVDNINNSNLDTTTKNDSRPKLQVEIPSISLFDPTPPPDDDNWDVKSNISDNIDDNFLYNDDIGMQRSSLFDAEPPSLRPDESSGIVRDQNTTRVETLDGSFFYPDAMSSRRLSSEIFNEQQSSDSFFVTKNKMEVLPQPNLQSIPEDSLSATESKMEITPSGEIDDSVFEQKSGDRNVKKSEEKISSEDAKSSVASISEMLKNMGQETVKKEKVVGSPGKIKHNLNINVNALLPGMSTPKIRDIKSQNESSPESVSPINSISSLTTPKNIPKQPVDFDNNNDNVEVLQSITKDRAKPLRRRPSTRKGRKEALRVSGIDFNVEDGERIEEKTPEINASKDNVRVSLFGDEKEDKFSEKIEEKTPEINTSKDNVGVSLFGDEKEDKFCEKIEEKTLEIEDKPKIEPSIFQDKTNVKTPVKKSSTLFDDEDEEDDLFQSSVIKKPTVPKKAEALFSDSPDSDKELFSGKLEMDKKKDKKQEKKSSLFDDSSSDDDLFGSSKAKQKVAPTTVFQKKPMKTVIKKLDNKETDEDPLSALLK